jgi:signal transduction histidine kinase
MADEALKSRRVIRKPDVEACGEVWELGWAPVDGALYLHYAINITERKRAEEALQRAHDRLDQRVKERTAELGRLSSRLLNVQEDERKAIARELHDSIGQSLAAVKFGLENVVVQLHQGAVESSIESLQSLIALLQQTSEEARRIHTQLRPSVLDDLGILLTIAWFSREFEKLHAGIRVEKSLSLTEEDVPDRLKIVIYRILQEAFNNIAKHSKARRARVSLGLAAGSLELRVEDDGLGFDTNRTDPRKEGSRGFGLLNMKERTELSGGTFSIQSGKGAGTMVRCNWPLER